MKIPTVEKFLCCIQLELGGLIWGYLSAIFSVLGIVSMVLGILGALTLLTSPDMKLHGLLTIIGMDCVSLKLNHN